MIEFKEKTGAIVDSDGRIIHLVEGLDTITDFPWSVVGRIHEKSPGKVFLLAHTTPPGEIKLSSTDKATLRTWANTLYPYPIRMSIITETSQKSGLDKAVLHLETLENMYVAFVEAEEQSEDGEHEVHIIPEECSKMDIWLNTSDVFPDSHWYGETLMRLSYDMANGVI